MTNSEKESVKKLAEEANAKIKESARIIKEDMCNFSDKVKDVKDEIIYKGKEKLCDAKASFEECSDEMIQSAKNNPVKSLLIAGAVGFALAALLLK